MIYSHCAIMTLSLATTRPIFDAVTEAWLRQSLIAVWVVISVTAESQACEHSLCGFETPEISLFLECRARRLAEEGRLGESPMPELYFSSGPIPAYQPVPAPAPALAPSPYSPTTTNSPSDNAESTDGGLSDRTASLQSRMSPGIAPSMQLQASTTAS